MRGKRMGHVPKRSYSEIALAELRYVNHGLERKLEDAQSDLAAAREEIAGLKRDKAIGLAALEQACCDLEPAGECGADDAMAGYLCDAEAAYDAAHPEPAEPSGTEQSFDDLQRAEWERGADRVRQENGSADTEQRLREVTEQASIDAEDRKRAQRVTPDEARVVFGEGEEGRS